jgi:hypothetical protein
MAWSNGPGWESRTGIDPEPVDVGYYEPPWVTEIRRQLDKEWAAYLRFLQQQDCPHLRVTEREYIEVTAFSGPPCFKSLEPRCMDCGKEMTDGEA